MLLDVPEGIRKLDRRLAGEIGLELLPRIDMNVFKSGPPSCACCKTTIKYQSLCKSWGSFLDKVLQVGP